MLNEPGRQRERRRGRVVVIALAAIVTALAGCRGRGDEDVEMHVRNVGFDRAAESPVVILESTAGRLLPIWIGPSEAQSIAVEMQKVTPPRPLTHDLVKRILDGTGTVLRRVRIRALEAQTFFATLVLDQSGREIEIDSRPSDAIALALRATCPILVSRAVLESGAAMELPAAGEAHVAKLWGVTVQDLDVAVAESLGAGGVAGVLVSDVDPAGEAALRRGDVIVAVDDVPVRNVAALRAVAESEKRARRLDVRRDGARVSVLLESGAGGGPRS